MNAPAGLVMIISSSLCSTLSAGTDIPGDDAPEKADSGRKIARRPRAAPTVGSPKGMTVGDPAVRSTLAHPWDGRGVRDIDAGGSSGSCVFTPYRTGVNCTRK